MNVVSPCAKQRRRKQRECLNNVFLTFCIICQILCFCHSKIYETVCSTRLLVNIQKFLNINFSNSSINWISDICIQNFEYLHTLALNALFVHLVASWLKHEPGLFCTIYVVSTTQDLNAPPSFFAAALCRMSLDKISEFFKQLTWQTVLVATRILLYTANGICFHSNHVTCICT